MMSLVVGLEYNLIKLSIWGKCLIFILIVLDRGAATRSREAEVKNRTAMGTAVTPSSKCCRGSAVTVP
jgi:hypothetical protein